MVHSKLDFGIPRKEVHNVASKNPKKSANRFFPRDNGFYRHSGISLGNSHSPSYMATSTTSGREKH